MKKKLRVFLLLIVTLVVQFWALAVTCQTIIPDPQIQTQINHIISLKEDEEVFDEISKLKQIGDGNIEHLLQQLIYFRANTKHMYNIGKINSSNMEKSMSLTAYIILREFLTPDESFEKFSSESAQHIINAVLPSLETKDAELKEQLQWMLEKIDFRGIDELDYAEYESYIESKKDNPPQALIKYMYEKSPGTALLSLMNVYMEDFMERQDIIQAEEAIREDIERRHYGPIEEKPNVTFEAMSALTELSKYEQWWVRLYVAEILLRQPEFRTPEILERLNKDKHPLVSEVLSRFSK